MNDHERRTTALLDTATRDLRPDLDRLVSGGVARGRRLRRRRRLGTALASAAVIAVIGAAAVVGPTLGGGGDRGAIDPPAASEPTAVPGHGARRIGIDPAKTAWVLASLLPSGEITGRTVWRSDVPGEYQGGRLVLDGGMVSVLLDASRAGRAHDPGTRCAHVGDGTCTELPGGDHLLTRSGNEPAEGEITGTRSNTVMVFTVEGLTVSVTAYNSPGEKGAAPTTDPVLTLAELRRIALDPVWLESQQ